MGVRCYESGVFWIHMAWCCVACVSGRCGVATIRAAVESGDGLRKLMFYIRKVIAGCGICLRDFVISLAIGPNKCDEEMNFASIRLSHREFNVFCGL